MFIGHFGVGFCSKRLAPSVSLSTLFLAAQFADQRQVGPVHDQFERPVAHHEAHGYADGIRACLERLVTPEAGRGAELNEVLD
jgi:hypothetical protein